MLRMLLIRPRNGAFNPCLRSRGISQKPGKQSQIWETMASQILASAAFPASSAATLRPKTRSERGRKYEAKKASESLVARARMRGRR